MISILKFVAAWLLDTESEYRDGHENILNSNDTINTPFSLRNSSVTSNNISKTKTSGNFDSIFLKINTLI